MRTRSFFSSADDALITYLDQSAFEHSLLMNVLFQDEVFIDEAFLWNSSLLEKHVGRAFGGRAKPSLFQRAAEGGIILPFSLDGPIESMEQAFDRLTRRYGKDYCLARITPAVQQVILRSMNQGLQTIRGKGLPAALSVSFGEAYLERLRSTLQHTFPPNGVSGLRSASGLNTTAVWPNTAKWRFDLLEEAAIMTQRKGARGLQRAELFNAIGRDLGIPESTRGATVGSLLGGVSEGFTRQALESFLRWTTQIHQLTRAKLSGIDANLPVFELNQDFFIDSLELEDDAHHSLEISLNLPPSEWLFSEGVHHVLEIRETHGEELLAALRAYREEPSQVNRERVVDGVKTYEILIGERCPVPSVSVSEIYFQSVQIALGVGTAINSHLPNLHTGAGVLGALAELGGVNALGKAFRSLRMFYNKRRETNRQQIRHEVTTPSLTSGRGIH